MTRLRRFLHLERERSAPLEPDVGPSSRQRFGSVDPSDDELARPAAAPSPAADRFREPAPRAPDVASPAPDAQPFVRCFRCETDNTIYAPRCTNCGAELDTPQQRRFNEALWTERRRQAQELEEEVRRLREASARAEEEASRARREMGELIAREVGRQERERLDREDGYAGGRWGQPRSGWEMGGSVEGDRRPLGIRLFYAIRNPAHRLVAMAVAVSVFVFLIAAGMMSPSLSGLLWIAMLLFAVLFAPRRRRWR